MRSLEEPSTPKSDRRRREIIDVARGLLFTHGLAGTTMSDIASKIGGSKTTLWVHFKSKNELFIAVIVDIMERLGSYCSIKLDVETKLELSLRSFALDMMSVITKYPIIFLHRTIIFEGQRFTELRTMLFEHDSQHGQKQLVKYIRSVMEDGRLRKSNPMVAAQHFCAMCKSGVYQDLLYGLVDEIEPEVIEREVDAVIDTFLKGWAL